MSEQVLLPPPPPQQMAFPQFIVQTGWFVILCPDTDLHRQVAQKLAQAKPGQILPMTPDEMALVMEFMPWPRLTESY